MSFDLEKFDAELAELRERHRLEMEETRKELALAAEQLAAAKAALAKLERTDLGDQADRGEIVVSIEKAVATIALGGPVGKEVLHDGEGVAYGVNSLGKGDDDEAVFMYVRAIPNPAANAPVGGVGVDKKKVRVAGKAALIAHLIPYANFHHDSLGVRICVNHRDFNFVKMIRYLHEDGYSVILQSASGQGI